MFLSYKLYLTLIVGFLFFSSIISFFRYLILYHFAEEKKQKMPAYDIGNFIKKYRNKNFNSSQSSVSSASKKSQQDLPLTPAISDSVLAGANVFHQYMLIDDYMYEGISRLSGKRIDNFSDLSSTVKDYSHNSDGLTEASLNKIKGHIAESHVAGHFKEAGAQVSWPDTSNQEGWDLLLNGQAIQVKLTKDASILTEHFKEHPGIPVVIPSDADNIPDTAFHFNPSEGVEKLMDYLKETSEEAVIVNHQLFHAELTENTEQATSFLIGDLDPFHFPLFTAAFSGFREFHLLKQNNTNFLSSLKNMGLDVAGVGMGGGIGGKIGTVLGSFISPGFGTAIGFFVGSIAGAVLGKNATNKIKYIYLKTAIKKCEESAENLKRQIKQQKEKYENQFNDMKKREQDNLNKSACKIKKTIDEKIKNLRKWIVEREALSDRLKNNLLNNIPVTISAVKKEKNLNWIEYFWPKKQTIDYQKKMKNLKKELTEQFTKTTFTDRGQLFQKFAEHGLCREIIRSEIEKTEKDRQEHESDVIKEIKQYQEQLLDQRSESIKRLVSKIKDYIQEMRRELSPYIKDIRDCQNLAEKEMKKLGKKEIHQLNNIWKKHWPHWKSKILKIVPSLEKFRLKR